MALHGVHLEIIVYGHNMVPELSRVVMTVCATRRALELLSGLALIYFAKRLFHLGAIRLFEKALQVGHVVNCIWNLLSNLQDRVPSWSCYFFFI